MYESRTPRVFALSVLVLGLLPVSLFAADWPTWRHDPGRRGVSPEQLPEKLDLLWVMELPGPRPAWPTTQTKLQFDRLYEPVLAEGTLFVPFMGSDKIVAFDAETAEEKWRFYAEGPIRLAATYSDGRLYFTSDDGHLYCLSAKDGELRWKFRGGPGDDVILGNDRMISKWPARGAPVVKDGVVYFGASIWPFMGIFFHALDAETGEEIWKNTGTGSKYLTQQHSSPAFAGVSPQGYLAVSGDHLVVSGGRTIPAVLDRHTGKFQHFVVDSRAMGSKGGGGFEVVVGENFYLNRGKMYRLDTGAFITSIDALVVNDRAIIARASDGLVGYEPRYRIVETKDRKGKVTRKTVVRKLFHFPLEKKVEEIFIQSGKRLYCAGEKNEIFAVDLPEGLFGAEISWSTTLDEAPLNMISGHGRLYVSTGSGKLYCFGAGKPDARVVHRKVAPEAAGSEDVTLIAENATWRYLDDVGDGVSGWTDVDFDASGWERGPGPLGYGEDFVKTELGFGGDKNQKRLAAYFRHEFDLPETYAGGKFAIDLLVDDGAILYLNGEELRRVYMPEGEVKPTTRAREGASESQSTEIEVPADLLRPGRNLLAVQVHQIKPTSSDLILRLSLGGTMDLAPPTRIVEEGSGDRPEKPAATDALVRRLLEDGASQDGYALVVGAGSGVLIDELLASTDLHLVVLENDPERIEALRRRYDEQGVYGRRIGILRGSLEEGRLPAYFAEWVISESALPDDLGSPAAWLRTVYHCLRPYSGRAAWPCSEKLAGRLLDHLREHPLDRGVARHEGGLFRMHRQDAPEGSSEWTHQNGDVANSVTSRDILVKAPLGVLWFGGPSNEGVLPRHGHGPTPQIVGGRLFIEGRNMIRAIDIYTGRLLWERELKDVGKHYDYTSHEPGANALGSNYVSLADGVYVVYQGKCLRLDPATGKTVKTFQLPRRPGEDRDPDWGYIGIEGDVLLGGADLENFVTPDYTPANFSGLKGDNLKKSIAKLDGLVDFEFTEANKRKNKNEGVLRAFLLANVNKLLYTEKIQDHIPLRTLIKSDAEGLVEEYEKFLTEVPGRKALDHGALVIKRKILQKCYGLPSYSSAVPGKFNSTLRTGSKRLVALDRHDGRVLWEHEAAYRIRHNAIAVGKGKVFLIDRMSAAQSSYFRRRGLPHDEKARVVALDLATGKELWEDRESHFGTWMSYSTDHDVVLQAGSKARDRAKDEVGKGMVAYRGRDGEVIWKNQLQYEGPCILLGDRVITQGYGKAGYALNIETGEQIHVRHPVTGEPTPWKYTRNYGCNTAIGSPHLLTFRSAAAGYYDLLRETGTGNLGGFRTGCTSNLIAAGGILNAPDYTRTCTCSYQNQSSLGLIHAPEMEMWTFSPHDFKDRSVERAGLNLGAPGDRRGPDGTYWLDFPSVGGKSPDIVVRAELDSGARYLRRHELELASHPLRWVGSSALVGSGRLEVDLVDDSDAGLVLEEARGGPPLRVVGIAPVSTPAGEDSETRPALGVARGEDFAARVKELEGLASDSITVEFWVLARRDGNFFDARVSGKEKKHGLVLDNRELRARYFVQDSKGKDNDDLVTLESSEKIPEGVWAHVAFTYDAASGRGRLFLDGRPVGEHDGPDGRPLWWDAEKPDLLLGDELEPGEALGEIRIARRALEAHELLVNSASELSRDDQVAHWMLRDVADKLADQALRGRFTVRLVFAELEGLDAGEREFDVLLQGKPVLEGLDVAREAGGADRTLVREFYNIPVQKTLKIELRARGSRPPLLGGIEVIRGVRGF